MEKMRGMMDDMVRVVSAIQRKARDEMMEEADSVNGGVQGYVFEDLSAHLATAVEETVCSVIVSQNSCDITGVSRVSQPLAKYARARFDPIPGRQPILEVAVIPAGQSCRGTLG